MSAERASPSAAGVAGVAGDARDALGEAFEPHQVEALASALRAVGEGLVSRADFERLEAMVRELLARSAPAASTSTPTPPTPPTTTAVTPEEIVIIAAAVTAYLGKRVRVRGARRLQPASQSAWGHQGRVFIQASHNLDARRGH